VGSKYSRKYASQTCGEFFLEEWFNNWGVNQISLQLTRPKIERDDKCITSATTNIGEACLIATLALGSRPRQRLVKVQANSEANNHISYSQECRRV
jgi:hypothetical protein